MLETLVSSRIKRTLLEYILVHPYPGEHFYLRGLARELALPVSPLRRELKRLERSGLLLAEPEGNIVFYRVDTGSPAFLQLQRVGQEATAPSPALMAGLKAQGSRLEAVTSSLQPPASSLRHPQAIPLGVIPASPAASAWRSPLSQPALIGAAVVGMGLLLVMAGLVYLTLTNQRLLSKTSQALAVRGPTSTAVTPRSSSSGAMRGTRWQIVPGGFGGFSSGANEGSY